MQENKQFQNGQNYRRKKKQHQENLVNEVEFQQFIPFEYVPFEYVPFEYVPQYQNIPQMTYYYPPQYPYPLENNFQEIKQNNSTKEMLENEKFIEENRHIKEINKQIEIEHQLKNINLRLSILHTIGVNSHNNIDSDTLAKLSKLFGYETISDMDISLIMPKIKKDTTHEMFG